MNIRAHHLLCMRYFKGEGYSKEFVSNFFKVIDMLNNNAVLEIINYPDIICSPCPHNKDNRCIKKGPESEKKVRQKDDKVIKHLGLKLGQRINSRDAISLVNNRLKNLKQICKDCEWREYCK